MSDAAMRDRLLALTRDLGPHTRDLRLGKHRIRLVGLDDVLVAMLSDRWGAFFEQAATGPASTTMRLFHAGTDLWLESPSPGESYRLEASYALAQRVVASYHFALAADSVSGTWRVGITETADELPGRVLDNATRFVAASMAIDEGGFAMHAAGLLHDGRAYVLAGPSGSGKTTASGLAAPARSLGDDFAIVLEDNGQLVVPALPFDNSERVQHEPPPGQFPLAGIWRLHQAESTRVERPTGPHAVASLLGCQAFPWAMPEAAGTLAERARRVVAEGRFHHLHFSLGPGLWTRLVKGSGEA